MCVPRQSLFSFPYLIIPNLRMFGCVAAAIVVAAAVGPVGVFVVTHVDVSPREGRERERERERAREKQQIDFPISRVIPDPMR